VGFLSVASACGGGSGNSTPTTPSGSGGVGATITITNAADPRDVRIDTGQSVRVVNNSTRSVSIKSDPHPTHGSCPPIDSTAAIASGASVVMGPFDRTGTCHYHDHNDPQNADLRGQIRIGVDNPGPGPVY
jgi:hypothetical protein